MLEDLSIKNFALIDSVNIEFKKGFTVLSNIFLIGNNNPIEKIKLYIIKNKYPLIVLKLIVC